MAGKETKQTNPMSEAAAQVSETAEQKFAEYQQLAQQYSEQATETIRENPMSSVLISFGIGLGVGVLISGLISGSPAPSTGRRTMRMAEDLGRQMLDSINEYIPDMISRRFQS